MDIVTDELNVKSFEFVAEASQLVAYRVLPDNKLLGPRFGARFPQVRAALAALDPASVAASVSADLPIVLQLDSESPFSGDETVEIAPSEVLVSTHPLPGLAVAADKLVTVAVDATLTPELKAEGLAREVVRRVQAMRKDASFDIADRITAWYQAGPELEAVFQAWGDYIMAETLSTRLVAGGAPPDAYSQSHDVDGQPLLLAIQVNPP